MSEAWDKAKIRARWLGKAGLVAGAAVGAIVGGFVFGLPGFVGGLIAGALKLGFMALWQECNWRCIRGSCSKST